MNSGIIGTDSEVYKMSDGTTTSAHSSLYKIYSGSYVTTLSIDTAIVGTNSSGGIIAKVIPSQHLAANVGNTAKGMYLTFKPARRTPISFVTGAETYKAQMTLTGGTLTSNNIAEIQPGIIFEGIVPISATAPTAITQGTSMGNVLLRLYGNLTTVTAYIMPLADMTLAENTTYYIAI